LAVNLFLVCTVCTVFIKTDRFFFHVTKIWLLRILLCLHGQIKEHLRKQPTRCTLCFISGFRLDVGQFWSLPGYYAACSSNTSLTFRDNLSVPSWISWSLQLGPIGCTETSVKCYHYIVRNSPEECKTHVVHYWKILLKKFERKKRVTLNSIEHNHLISLCQ